MVAQAVQQLRFSVESGHVTECLSGGNDHWLAGMLEMVVDGAQRVRRVVCTSGVPEGIETGNDTFDMMIRAGASCGGKSVERGSCARRGVHVPHKRTDEGPQVMFCRCVDCVSVQGM